jgi:NADH-quinone oxidoreductase subunit M
VSPVLALVSAGATLAVEEASAPATFALLPALIIIPVLTALVIGLLPASRGDYAKVTALMGSTITGAVSLFVLAEFNSADGGFQLVSRADMVPSLGLSWYLAVDGISLFLVVLTGILFPIAIVTTEAHHQPKPYYLWLMLLMAGIAVVTLAFAMLLPDASQTSPQQVKPEAA